MPKCVLRYTVQVPRTSTALVRDTTYKYEVRYSTCVQYIYICTSKELLGTRYILVRGKYFVPRTRYLVRGTRYTQYVHSTQYEVRGTRYIVLGACVFRNYSLVCVLYMYIVHSTYVLCVLCVLCTYVCTMYYVPRTSTRYYYGVITQYYVQVLRTYNIYH